MSTHRLIARTCALVSVLIPALLPAQRPASSQARRAVGIAVSVRPSYSGSDEMRLRPMPMVQLSTLGAYIGPSAVNPGGIAAGIQPVRSQHFTIVVEANAREGRPASRGDALAGMDDRGETASLGTSLSYRLGPIEALAGVAQGLNDGAGILGTTRLSLGYRARRLLVAVGAGITVSDAKQMRRDFGITEEEARRRSQLIASGDPRLGAGDGVAYRPDGGVRSRNANAITVVALSDRWSALTFASLERLSKDAAQSPVVRRRDQRSIGVGVMRRF